MSLAARLQAVDETVAEMERAAEDRFQEGSALIQVGLWHAGAYLLGYAAEILLKTAVCRTDPTVTPNVLVDAKIGPARAQWRALFGGRPSGHDLLFLGLWLEEERRLQRKPGLNTVSQEQAARFSQAVGRLSENWSVAMRYHRQGVPEAEARDLLDDVTWLRAHYEFLWR